MNKYVYKLGEFSGSDYLEFRKGNSGAGRKILRQDSLYVLDNAFYFFLESAFQKVFVSFDMFEDTSVTRGEWRKMMQLNIPETVENTGQTGFFGFTGDSSQIVVMQLPVAEKLFQE